MGAGRALWVSAALQAICSVFVGLLLPSLPGYKLRLVQHPEYSGLLGIVVVCTYKMDETLEALG